MKGNVVEGSLLKFSFHSNWRWLAIKCGCPGALNCLMIALCHGAETWATPCIDKCLEDHVNAYEFTPVESKLAHDLLADFLRETCHHLLQSMSPVAHVDYVASYQSSSVASYTIITPCCNRPLNSGRQIKNLPGIRMEARAC